MVSQEDKELAEKLWSNWCDISDAANAIFARRELGLAVEWREIDALLEKICGKMERRKRCDDCGGAGDVTWPHPKFGVTVGHVCGTCNGTGYQKGTLNHERNAT